MKCGWLKPTSNELLLLFEYGRFSSLIACDILRKCLVFLRLLSFYNLRFRFRLSYVSRFMIRLMAFLAAFHATVRFPY